MPSTEVLVASTGVIGVPLRMDCLRRGIPAAAAVLDRAGGADAAAAILTTDSGPKTAAVEVILSGDRVVRVGGMAKGAGMIRPDMATTLCFLTTDAELDGSQAATLARTAAQGSFNRITVDGDTSTNDCLILLANGAAAAPLDGADHERLAAGVLHVATELARMVVRDGEGATKLVEVRVLGARSDQEATRAAFTVAESLLVKTAIYGGEPNWGRILAAVGRAGVAVEERRVAIRFNELQVVAGGLPVAGDLEEAAAELAGPEVLLSVDLGLGDGSSTVWTCDLTEEYVRINGSYIS
jgi:glutamate N-acetyltransferase/amino-acid N-acetyltransferase